MEVDQSEVEKSLAYLESVLAHGPAGFALLDRDLRYTRVNRRLAEINGLPVEAHLGRTVEDVLGRAQWVSRRLLFEQALAGQAVVDALLEGTPSVGGSMRRVSASYYPITMEAQVVGVAVVVRDLSDLAQAEEALEQREREYRLLFLAHPQPMWVYDTETLGFLAVNDCAVQVYGYSREEFLTMTLADIRPNDDLPAVRKAVQTPRSGAYTDGPWRHLRRDGSLLWVEITACSLEFENRAARLIVALDVTERVKIEGERQDNARRQQKFLRDVLASVTDGKLRLLDLPSQLPLPFTPVGDPIGLTETSGLRELRRQIWETAAAAGYPEVRTYDLAMAACEAGMNAIVHAGGGTAQVAVGAAGEIQVRVEDQGKGITMEDLPRAALVPGYSTASTLGYGLKMILQTVDRVFLLTGLTGTTLVLEQDREPPSEAVAVEKALGLVGKQ